MDWLWDLIFPWRKWLDAPIEDVLPDFAGGIESADGEGLDLLFEGFLL